MEREIIISPEELYFLGSRLQAKYIDYAYVAAMDDIGQNYPLFEKETGAALVSKGVLEEDFSGNIEINSGVSDLLKPIFFGEVETSIDICEIGKTNTVSVYKFHFYDGAITLVTGKDGKLLIKKVDSIEIQDIVKGLIPQDIPFEYKVVDDIPRELITRFFAFKSILVGKTAVVKTYIEAGNVLLQEKDSEQIETVSKETFISDATDIVKGV